MPWWRRNRAAVDDTIACERSGSAACPDCRAGRGCSRDRFYEPVARIATFGSTGAIDKNNIKNRLFGRVGGERTPKRAYYDWTDPRCVAHMVWLVVTWTKARNQGVTAAKYLAQARADDYHPHDPRLARLVCEAVAETSGLDAAAAEVRRVFTDRSSDPAGRAHHLVDLATTRRSPGGPRLRGPSHHLPPPRPTPRPCQREPLLTLTLLWA